MFVRPLAREELALLERHVDQDFGNRDKHRLRLALQEEGLATYLVAWLSGLPVGHVLVRWAGADAEPARSRLAGCPDLEDLFVVPGLRSTGIGSRLLDAAERLARENGHVRIGMSVDVANDRARALYERRGYADAGLGCTYLVRTLA